MCLALAACCCGGAFTTVSASSYEYGYGVADPVTGDVKEQRETKDCDQVSGYYKTLDADGMMRTVTYTSHPLTGFQAQVDRQPYGAGPVVEPLVKAAAGPAKIVTVVPDAPPAAAAVVEQKAVVPAIDVKEEIRVQTPAPLIGQVKLAAPPAEWRYEPAGFYGSPAPTVDIKPGVVATPAPLVDAKIVPAAVQGPPPIPISARIASSGPSPYWYGTPYYYYRTPSSLPGKWIGPEYQAVSYVPAAGPKYYSAVPEPCNK